MTELFGEMLTTEFGVIVLGFIIGFSIISFVLKNKNKSEQSTKTPSFLGNDNWWSILGVSPDASEDDIREAYQRQLSECEAARYLGDTRKMSVNAAIKKIPLLHRAYEEAIKQRNQKD